MDTIPVIYARGGKLTSWLIRLFTWSQWSHVAVVTESGGHVIESVGGRGVIYTPITEFRARYKTYQEAELPVASAVDAYKLLHAELAKPYDMTAIYSMILRRDWDETDSWFCSELVAYASQLFRHDSVKRVTPEHLWRISK